MKGQCPEEKGGPQDQINSNSAPNGERIQLWTEADMQKVMGLHKTGKLYNQRVISRITGIHIVTFNQHFRDNAKDTNH